jgi:hypothetical protein
VCQTSGQQHEVNAYRSELQGIHASLLAIAAICTIHNVAHGRIVIACDNETGVKLANGDWLKVGIQKKHVDMIRSIRRIKASLTIKVLFQHVKGHQDSLRPFAELSRLSQLNVSMDKLAKSYLCHLLDKCNSTVPSNIHGEGWSCWIDHTKTTTDPTAQIRDHVFRQPMRDYLHRKGKVDEHAFAEIDWAASGAAFDSFPQLFRLWATKHVSGWCGVNSMRFAWGMSETHHCPNCGSGHEMTAHIPVCPALSMQECWTDSIDGFEIWLTTVDTHPDIQQCILDTLRERSTTASFSQHSTSTTLLAAKSQDRIGWLNLIEGKVSTHWRDLQARHYKELSSRRTANSWATELIVNLLEISHAQWIQRNDGLYEVADNGLPTEEAAQLLIDIQEAMAPGTKGLNKEDHYLIKSMEYITSLNAAEQQRWLQTLHFARQSWAEEHNTTLGRQRILMNNFVIRTPRT